MKKLLLLLLVLTTILCVSGCKKEGIEKYYGTYKLEDLDPDPIYTEEDKKRVLDAYKDMTVIIEKTGCKVSRDGINFEDITIKLDENDKGTYNEGEFEGYLFFKDNKLYFDGSPLAVYFILGKQ
ncbi:MAG: hypothetical protein IJG59_06160 [Erysipelotrichaceae bacterium]|nr:hypothetical protein [Erysipelotrichaceae bacterium]